jgi:hypothetical protein
MLAPVFSPALIDATRHGRALDYIGMVDESLNLRETKGSRHKADTPQFRSLLWALAIIAGRLVMPEGGAIMNAGRCLQE